MTKLNGLIIDDESLFEGALRNGINLFLGSGFAKLARGESGILPTGYEFEQELRLEFKDLNLPTTLDLSTISTIIKSQRAAAFRDFCTNRFSVVSFDERYGSIFSQNVKSIFTTNIDNLVPKVVDLHQGRYIHDIFLAGNSPTDERSISYFALHGCVNHGQRDYVFGTTEIASAYGDDPQLWNYFAQKLSTMPTLFWGYGMRDSGTLQAMQSAAKGGRSAAQNKWILLKPEEKSNEAYYRALDLTPIYGDSESMLDYFDSLDMPLKSQVKYGEAFSAAEFPEFRIPAPSSVPVREANFFFEGSEPSWYDIFQNIPAFTEHVRRISNLIAGGKDILIQGVAASGKTTLLKMLANAQENPRESILFVSGYMETAKAEIMRKIIGERPVKIFWDNVFDTTEAVSVIQSIPNAQLIAADRDYIYQFGYHRLNMTNIEIYDCSDLVSRDTQRVIEKIPLNMRNMTRVREIERSKDPVSIFDVIQTVSFNANISTRIRKIFADLSKEDEIYRELFVLISYFHNARVPASFDAVASYCGLSGIGVMEVYGVMERLGGFVKEYNGAFSTEDQDYFAARSQIFAESCMDVVPAAILKKVITRVLKEISIVKIPFYSVFQRGAFRNELFARAFPNWREGLELYEMMVDVALTDRPKPYIKQQCALYLAQRGQFGDAFAMIDDAVRMSGGRLPTIRHTQARIKFEANIDIEDDLEGYVHESLISSMVELENCRNVDSRKQRHTEYFAKFALMLDDRYSNDETMELVVKAERWLAEETGRPGFSRRIARLLQNVRARLSIVR